MDILLLVVSAIVFFIIIVFIVEWLWNSIMPDLFKVEKINFWQVIGLMILISFFFGGHVASGCALYSKPMH